MSRVEVRGLVAEGFEHVRAVFEAQAGEVGKGGAAFAAFVGHDLVVDLWAGDARPGEPWQRDTPAVFMSATKGVTTVALQVLHSRGLVDLDAPVAAYWPEFGQNGKEAITVRQVLSHRAGLVSLPGHEELLGWDGTGWDDDERIAAALAGAAPDWPPGTRHGYHALTFGWLVGELVRRIDGRSLATFVIEEIAEPLGIDLRIGTPVHEQHRLAVVVPPGPLDPAVRPQTTLLDVPGSLPARAFFGGADGSVLSHLDEFLAGPRALAAPLGGSTGAGTARDLATLYAALAADGVRADGTRFLEAATVDAFARESGRGLDAVQLVEMRWALGYQLPVMPPPGVPRDFGPTETAFGHHGIGGQLGFADRENGVAVAFVRSHLSWTSMLGGHLVEALYGCLA